METVLESATKKVVIGPDKPFVIIGERINPTGRKVLATQLEAGDFTTVEQDAVSQLEAGAVMLDVNAGVPGADEAKMLVGLVELVQELTEAPLSVDSAMDSALAAALPVCQGKPLVNSVNGEEERLENILPLIKERGAAVIGLVFDEAGPSMDPDERLRIAKLIVERAADHGIPRQDVLIDPLAMTVGAEPQAAVVALETIRLVRQELGNNMTIGASNISFGLPGRKIINYSFLALAMSAGLTSAITNPLVPETPMTLMACDLLLARDEYGMNWIKAHRK
ncbi:MAG: dihydropteroate synthase [Thermoanaerobaculia bacterium]